MFLYINQLFASPPHTHTHTTHTHTHTHTHTYTHTHTLLSFLPARYELVKTCDF